MDTTLLDACRQIQAISQSGLTFSKDPYDRERFQRLTTIAADLIAGHTSHSKEYIERIFSAEAGYATPKLDVRGRGRCRWPHPHGSGEVHPALDPSRRLCRRG